MEKKPVKLTHLQTLSINKALTDVGSVKGNAEFSMAVALNRSILKPYVTALGEQSEPSDKFKAFLGAKEKVMEDIGANVQNDGNNTFYVVPKEKMQEYKDAVSKLEKKYKKTLDEHNEQARNLEEVVLPSLANGGDPIELYVLKAPLPDSVDGNTLFELMELIEVPD